MYIIGLLKLFPNQYEFVTFVVNVFNFQTMYRVQVH